MRRNARPVSPLVRLLFAAALAAMMLPATRAAADDAATCEKASGAVAIAACTQGIASGRYQGHALAELRYNRGVEYRRTGDAVRAIADYDAAIRLDPNDACALYNRGLAWSDKDDNDRAIADFSATVRLSPRDARELYALGMAKRQRGDVAGSAADIAAAKAIKADIAEVFAN